MAGNFNSLFGDVLDDCSSAGILDGTRNAVQLGMIYIPVLGDALGMLIASWFLVIVMFVLSEMLFHGLSDALEGE